MTHVSILSTNKCPWLLKSFSSSCTIGSSISYQRSGNKLVLKILNGKNLATVEQLMNEFNLVMEFPSYFGKNSAALFDCLTDLSWLPAEEYVLVLTNVQSILIDEPVSELMRLLELLERACEAWAQPIALGALWDRSAVPFHVIFQVCSQTEMDLHSLISRLPELELHGKSHEMCRDHFATTTVL